ncbi:hypothetical protein BH24DEI1_BH24DEI1_12770 [soil metagenome]
MSTELVSFIAQNLVAEPAQLRVEARQEEGLTLIEIRCAPGDAGRIIGRGGRVINRIRTLARAAADGQSKIDVKMVEN